MKWLYPWAGPLVLITLACAGAPDLRPVDPAVSALVARLDDRGVTTTQSSLVSAPELCLDEYESSLHVFLPVADGRIDLYPFEDESAARAVASEIPLDADCRVKGDHVDLSVRGPYFLCGAVIAFVGPAQSPVFEELCGPPFAVTPVVTRFEDAFEVVPSVVPISSRD